MTRNLAGRVTRLETHRGPRRDLRDMTDDELRDLAGPPSPVLAAALACLTDDELAALADAPTSPAGQAALERLDRELIRLTYDNEAAA